MNRICNSNHDACNQLIKANILTIIDDAIKHIPSKNGIFAIQIMYISSVKI